MTETWIEIAACNRRSHNENWDWWDPSEEEVSFGVEFVPFKQIDPIYCECIGIGPDGEILILDVPSEGPDDYAEWFAAENSWIAVHEQLVRPQ